MIKEKTQVRPRCEKNVHKWKHLAMVRAGGLKKNFKKHLLFFRNI